ncbi:MAG: c-type cytochrome [Gammaproteobacteria bacterium]|nr:c-type cytochrome [Gammaproteobacteria bacterium]
MAFLYSAPDNSLAQDSVYPLITSLNLKLADTSKRLQAIEMGKERALLCGYCHGKDGNSVKDDVPNLAQQNPAYLLIQINKFATGERKDYVMNSLASKFTDDEQISLAIYYARQKLKLATVDQTSARLGQSIYRAKCVSCHGENGYGKENFARLAGQKSSYTIKTLQGFRANTHKQPGVSGSKRSSPLMEMIVKDMSDQDIKHLAAYVAQLR